MKNGGLDLLQAQQAKARAWRLGAAMLLCALGLFWMSSEEPAPDPPSQDPPSVVPATPKVSSSPADLDTVNGPPEGESLPEVGRHEPAAMASVPRGLFIDVTAEAGIDFEYRNGAAGDKLLPETMGGGVAFVDLLDQDGDPDLLFVGGSPWSAFEGEETGREASLGLFRNDGTGRFQDVTSESGLEVTLYGMGPAVGDFDGDHDLDIFISGVGGHRLFRNDDGFFVDVTASAGLAEPAADKTSEAHGASGAEAPAVPWSTGATFFDSDRDGDLDLFICHYVRWSPAIERRLEFRLEGIGRAYGPPQEYAGTQSQLFLNEGGRFTDVSRQLGLWVPTDPALEPLGKALAVKPTDLDDDGWMDLWVANDTTRNFLFRNLGAGRGFEEVGEWWGLAYDSDGRATGSMGLDLTFPEGSAEPMLLAGNYAEEMSSLYRGDGSGEFFTDESAALGLGPASRDMLTFGAIFLDVDLDGSADLLQVNGHVEPEIEMLDPSQTYRQPAQLFWGSGGGRLELADPEVLGDLVAPRAGRGVAFGDMDGDGDLDVVMTEPAGRPVLLRNELRSRHIQGSSGEAQRRKISQSSSAAAGRLGGHWIRLRLKAPGPNSWALGARVELITPRGRRLQELTPTRGYLSQSEMALTFGLGDSAEVTEIKIRWPDATEQTLAGLPVDRSHTVHHPLLKETNPRKPSSGS